MFTTYGDILSPTSFLVHGYLLYFNTYYMKAPPLATRTLLGLHTFNSLFNERSIGTILNLEEESNTYTYA